MPTEPSTGGGPRPATGLNGWADLRYSVAAHLPNFLRQSDRYHRSAVQKLAHRRKR